MEVLEFSQLSGIDKFFVIFGIICVVIGFISIMANMMSFSTGSSNSNAGMKFGIISVTLGLLLSIIFMFSPIDSIADLIVRKP